MEQEMASIIRFVQTAAGNPKSYFGSVPQGFEVPSIYYPVPEVTTHGHTLSHYAFDYMWFIKVFDTDDLAAYTKGLTVLTALNSVGGAIPAYNQDGTAEGHSFRIKDPSLKKLDDTGVIQLTIQWSSNRAFTAETEALLTAVVAEFELS